MVATPAGWIVQLTGPGLTSCPAGSMSVTPRGGSESPTKTEARIGVRWSVPWLEPVMSKHAAAATRAASVGATRRRTITLQGDEGLLGEPGAERSRREARGVGGGKRGRGARLEHRHPQERPQVAVRHPHPPPPHPHPHPSHLP